MSLFSHMQNVGFLMTWLKCALLISLHVSAAELHLCCVHTQKAGSLKMQSKSNKVAKAI